MSAVSTAPRPASKLDPQNPWPGLAAFEEGDSPFFHGRDTAVNALLNLIAREDLILLYGTSGLGKTSLLRAGLFPKLPPTVLPVYIRLHYGSASDPVDAADLRDQVLDAVHEQARLRGVEVPQPAASGTLWEFFRRRDQAFWGGGMTLVIPLLVFDQFEQLFTRDSARTSSAGIDEFLADLSDLASGRLPAWVADDVTDEEQGRRFIFESPGCKMAFSFREDYLADVKRLDRLITTTDRNYFRLGPMRWAEGVEAVRDAAQHLLAPRPDDAAIDDPRDPAAAIVKAVADRPDDPSHAIIDPSILSVFCSELNEERKARAGRGESAIIDSALVQSRDASQIIATFYRRAVELAPDSVRQFIEQKLIVESSGGKWVRDSVAYEQIGQPGLPYEAFNSLIDKWRILRVEPVGQRRRLELTHDVLVGPVLESRRARDKRNELQRAVAENVEKERIEREAITQKLEQENRERLLIEKEARRTKWWLDVAKLLGFLVFVFGILSGMFFLRTLRQGEAAEARAIDRSTSLAFDTYRGDRRGEGLAQLAALLREHPANTRLRALTLDLLLARGWWLPVAGTKLDGPATATEFSPDGRMVVTTSSDGTGRIWRASTGETIADFHHGSPIWTAAFSPDSRLLVTAAGELKQNPVDDGASGYATDDNTAGVWDALTGKRLASLSHDNKVAAAEFSPDGELVVTASSDQTAAVWSTRTWKRVQTLQHQNAVRAARFSADSRMIVTASDDRSARVWNARTGRAITTPLWHDNEVTVAAFNSYGEWFATADDHGAVRLWRVSPAGAPASAATMMAELPHPDQPVHAVRFSADGVRLLTVQASSARVWDLSALADDNKRGRTIPIVMRQTDPVKNATLYGTPTDERVLTVSSEGVVRSWQMDTGQQTGTLTGPLSVTVARADLTGAHLVTASSDGTAMTWQFDSGSAISHMLDPQARTGIAAFSPDGRSVLTTTVDGALDLWEVSSGRRQQLQPGAGADKPMIHLAEFGGDDRLLVVSGDVVHIWRRSGAAWQHGASTSPEAGAITSAHFDRSGTHIVTGSSTGSVKVWTTDGREVAKAPNHRDYVWSAEFSQDGRYIVSTSKDRTAHIVDAATGQAMGSELRHGGDVFVARFSRDGSRVVTGSADGKAAVWNVGSADAIRVLQHAGPVIWVQFSRDGKDVLTAAEDGTLRIWDTLTGKPMARTRAHNGQVRAVDTSADGLRIASGGSDGTLGVWDAATLEPQSEGADMRSPIALVRMAPDGARVVVVTTFDRAAHVVDFSVGTPDDAGWVANFAEHVGGMRATEAGVASALPSWAAGLAAMRTAAATAASGHAGREGQFLNWFFARPDSRPPSPFERP
jgi:WD40 repeat protein